MEAEQLEGLITLEQASSALKNMTNGKPHHFNLN
jgi:hypothetical protein